MRERLKLKCACGVEFEIEGEDFLVRPKFAVWEKEHRANCLALNRKKKVK